jgi:UDP-glucose 4-epimerase
MRLLITGGSGYLGHLLAQRCATMPSVGELRILDVEEPSEPVAGATYLDGDVTSPADVKSAMSGVDAVVHLAGPTEPEIMLRYPASGLHLAVNGTNTVLDAARAHGETHVILASSEAVYGANPAVPAHEGLTPMPHDPFAVAKLAAENLAARVIGFPSSRCAFSRCTAWDNGRAIPSMGRSANSLTTLCTTARWSSAATGEAAST